MTLQLHRPDNQGALRPVTSDQADWRKGLRSRRWRVAPIRNTEMNPTSTPMAIAFWAALGILTFAILMLGYGTHFWHF
jgi:hypothetical protein